MSVGTSRHPPYHLRPKKAIDRFLLVDLLQHIPFEIRKKYEYVGLGGPFLEDFKVIRHYFPEMACTSLEANEETYKRQKFNRFSKAVRLVRKDIATYFEEHDDFHRPLVVWFDGTDFRLKTLKDLVTILSRLPLGSVLKITARVSFDVEPKYKEFAKEVSSAIGEYVGTLEGIDSQYREEISATVNNILSSVVRRKDELTSTMQAVEDYLPEGYEELLGDQASKAKLCFQVILNAIMSVYPVIGDTRFHVISSNYYSDDTTMISISGMLINKTELPRVTKMFKGYGQQGDQISEPTKIDVPVLSVKERIKLDSKLPLKKNIGDRLLKALGYLVDSTRPRSQRQLEFYNSYHRYYPFFSKVQF